MLDRTSRKFLKFIVKNEPNMGDHLFTFDFVGKSLGMSKEETFECIRFLDGQGLLRCVYIEMPGGPKALHGFEASHKGRHQAEFARLEIYQTI